MRFLGISTLCLTVAFLTLTASAADKVANPAYKNWSSFKVGTWTKLESDMQAGDAMQAKMTMTQKLVELTPEAAVIEVTMSMNMQGQEMAMPGRKMTIPAMIDASKADTAMLSPDAQGEVSDVQQGDETITVTGKSLPCHWISATVKQGPMSAKTKSWTTAEIPGGLVKTEIKNEQMNMTLVLVGFEVAK